MLEIVQNFIQTNIPIARSIRVTDILDIAILAFFIYKLLWMFRIPWGWTYTAGTVSDWIAQFSFGFYSLMLTSTIIGLVVNTLFKPRTWCSFCPMGTMTQMICRIKAKEKL